MQVCVRAALICGLYERDQLADTFLNIKVQNSEQSLIPQVNLAINPLALLRFQCRAFT